MKNRPGVQGGVRRCLGIIEANTGCNLDCPICSADSGPQPDGHAITPEDCARMLDVFVARRPDAASPDAHTRLHMERDGQVYRALRHRFSHAEADVTVVDRATRSG